MKIQKKRLSAAITLALTLTMIVAFMTPLVTFGQDKIAMTMTNTRYPTIVGINQNVLLIAWLRPTVMSAQTREFATGPYRAINHNFTFIITRPDGTVENVTTDTNIYSQAIIRYNSTQLGTYSWSTYWPGDATYASIFQSGAAAGVGPGGATTTNWTCRAQPTAEIVKTTTEAREAVTAPLLGLGQQQLIIGWINPPPPSAQSYFDCTHTITKPDGTVVTVKQDSTADGSTSFQTLCDQTGVWSVKLSWAGDDINLPCETPLSYWTVQTEPVPSTHTEPALPNYPWQFPVSAEYRQWYQITGPWQTLRADGQRSSFNPYSKGPTSGHILWRTPIVKGGLLGGANQQGPNSNTGEMSSAGAWESSMARTTVAADGRIYYVKAERYAVSDATSAGSTHNVIYCIDIYTGQQIYRADLPGTGSAGYLYLDMSQAYKQDPTSRTAFTLYVFGSNSLWAVDPWNGQCTYYTNNFPGQGGINDGYIYRTNYPLPGNFTKTQLSNRATIWTVQLPTNPFSGSYVSPNIFNGWLFSNGMTWSTATTGENPTETRLWTWNITDGSLVANGVVIPNEWTGTAWLAQDGKIIALTNADLKARALDMVTGQIDWTSPAAEYPWGSFQAYQSAGSWGPMGGGYDLDDKTGQVYIPSYDGNLYCFSNTDGHLIWKFFCGNTTETGMGHHIPWSEIIIADNKVYFTVGEHTNPYPMPADGHFYCVDARTGELIWELNGFYEHVWDTRHMSGIMGGIIWYPNKYDGCLYGIGKGESATTVSASPKVVANGASVLIEGTVTDQSPGTTSFGQPAAGTPAVSDDSQPMWMGYLYQNQPMPTNATGVTVFLQALGSDGTLMDITHVTSDALGHYEYTWTPPGEDTYKIIATFEGSESYYTSAGQTGLSVGAASPTSVPPEAPVNYTPMVIGTGAAVIIAVAIVGVLLFRKRP
jgi:outer membrane protein assembly factor BamB